MPVKQKDPVEILSKYMPKDLAETLVEEEQIIYEEFDTVGGTLHRIAGKWLGVEGREFYNSETFGCDQQEALQDYMRRIIEAGRSAGDANQTVEDILDVFSFHFARLDGNPEKVRVEGYFVNEDHIKKAVKRIEARAGSNNIVDALETHGCVWNDKDEVEFLSRELDNQCEATLKLHENNIKLELANRRLVDIITKSGNPDLLVSMEMAVDIFW